MNDRYGHELRLMMNMFQPAIKLLTKVRVGSKLVRRYDIPKTPLDRLIAARQGLPAKIKELQRLQQTLDPFELAQTIEHKLAHISALAHHRSRSTPSPPVERRHAPSRTPTPSAADACRKSNPQATCG